MTRNKKEMRVYLSVMTTHCVRLLERGKKIEIIEIEREIMSDNLIGFMQSRFGKEIDLTLFNSELTQASKDWPKVNAEIKNWLNSEIHENNPGRSARKWGITYNGLAFVIALCADLLAQED
jgi:hypothetical protein